MVAAATGPVGSAVGQIAKLKGARAVGIAGGPDKVRALTEEFGFDVGVDHRADDFREQLAAAVPDGIDVYFENVGGAVFDAVRRHLNLYARIPVCGLVAGYNATEAPTGPDRMPGLLAPGADQEPDHPRLHPGRVRRRPTTATSCGRCRGWVRDGIVRYREDVDRRPGQRAGGLRGHAARHELREAAGQGVVGHTTLRGWTPRGGVDSVNICLLKAATDEG